jgi:hypothetical protein
VKDDGVGPPPAADTPETVREAALEAARDGTGGLGLHLMSYRARMIGGQLDIRRGSEGGMVLTCVWPVGAPLAVPSATTASAPGPATASAAASATAANGAREEPSDDDGKEAAR